MDFLTPLSPLALTAGVGLVLGLRHAFEPDHLAAVSTLATREGRLWPAARLGLLWGTGHTVAVGAVALAVIILGVRLPEAFWPWAEAGVGVLLVILGGAVVWRYARGRWHMHRHAHGSDAHLHLHSHASGRDHAHAHPRGDPLRSLGFGVAHGLAGSGAVMALIVAAAPGAVAQATYFVAFGVGTIVGMLVVSLVLGTIVRAAAGRGETWAAVLHLSSAGASIVIGLLLVSTLIPRA